MAEVDPEALAAFATTSRGRAQRFGELARSLTDGRVGRLDFGPYTKGLQDILDSAS